MSIVEKFNSTFLFLKKNFTHVITTFLFASQQLIKTTRDFELAYDWIEHLFMYLYY